MTEIENHVVPYGFNLSVVFPIIGSDLSNVVWMLHVDGILVWSEIKLNFSVKPLNCRASAVAGALFN